MCNAQLQNVGILEKIIFKAAVVARQIYTVEGKKESKRELEMIKLRY